MNSAKTYYQFLEKRGKGIASVSVRSIQRSENGTFLLRLSSRLSAAASSNLEGLQFQFYGGVYDGIKDITPIEYSSVNASLLVHPSPHLLAAFSALKPGELTVYSDLKFLVKRVETWYAEHGHEIIEPSHLPAHQRPVLVPVPGASDEQLAAIDGALSSSLSYIWGAPGTGKTLVVLSSCVLSLLRAQRKLLILAPTNNALEQMLYGLLPALEENGIGQAQVIRLGTPTTRFADRYPAVCEAAGVSRSLAQIENEVAQIKSCLQYRSSCTKFSVVKNQIEDALSQFLVCSDAYLQEQATLDRLTSEEMQYRVEEALLRRESVQLLSALEASQRSLSGFGGFLKRHILPGWYARHRAEEERAAHMLQENHTKLDNLSARMEALKRQISEHTISRDGHSAVLLSMKKTMLQTADFWPQLQSAIGLLSESDPNGSSQQIQVLFEKTQQVLSQKACAHISYEEYSDIALDQLLNELTVKSEILRTSTTEERLSHVSIVAATLDKFITLYLPSTSFHPDHVFLDEAGYCPLIKGAPLLSLGVPVTFLGDHMQLPPICEMGNRELQERNNQNVCLWAQSAIYLDEVFLSDPNLIYAYYQDGLPPPYFDIQKYDLSATYRFGTDLAGILASYVYTSQFHSVCGTYTELCVLDAPRSPNVVPRTSVEEVNAITHYLNTVCEQDYAILTPYRKQLAALVKQFSVQSREERILTVHASQGREWDTVFFSVVDTSDMWFCDSLNRISKGCQVINTAVSRARKRLILVCDYKYWSAQPDQLICQLVRAAKKLN